MNDGGFSLRPAENPDLEQIAALWHASASLPGVGPAVMPAETELRSRLDRELATGWSLTVAESSGRIVGFLAMDRARGVLAELFVRPDWLGRRVGRELLAQAKALMPTGFTLHTRSTNAAAQHFYEREGLFVSGFGVHPRTGDAMIHYRWGGC